MIFVKRIEIRQEFEAMGRTRETANDRVKAREEWNTLIIQVSNNFYTDNHKNEDQHQTRGFESLGSNTTFDSSSKVLPATTTF